jgi:hypothetical protein
MLLILSAEKYDLNEKGDTESAPANSPTEFVI